MKVTVQPDRQEYIRPDLGTTPYTMITWHAETTVDEDHFEAYGTDPEEAVAALLSKVADK